MFTVNSALRSETPATHYGSIGNRFRSQAFLLLAVLVLSMLAYSQNRDTILLLNWDAREIDFGGGRGGGLVPDARCDGGFVAVGFHVRTGEFFNEAWLDCAPMRSDGSLGQERRVTSGTGTRGGRDVHDAVCPPGRVLRGLTGRTGASIDEAIGVCGTVIGRDDRRRDDDRFRDDDRRRDDDRPRADDRDRDRRDQRWDRDRGDLTVPVTIPHPGGRPAEALCPPNSVLVGFRARSGEWIDHLSILCAEIQRSY